MEWEGRRRLLVTCLFSKSETDPWGLPFPGNPPFTNCLGIIPPTGHVCSEGKTLVAYPPFFFLLPNWSLFTGFPTTPSTISLYATSGLSLLHTNSYLFRIQGITKSPASVCRCRVDHLFRLLGQSLPLPGQESPLLGWSRPLRIGSAVYLPYWAGLCLLRVGPADQCSKWSKGQSGAIFWKEF